MKLRRGGESEMKKCIIVLLGIFSMLFTVVHSSYALWDKPCGKRQIMEVYYCKDCKEVREFDECSEIGYIWDFKAHKDAGDKKHTSLPLAWGCQKIAYSCINTACEAYGKCIPHPGICEVCMDDITSTKVWSRATFKCPKCGSEHGDPGKNFKVKEGLHPAQLQTGGECEACGGVELEIVCEKSGTCPHVER